MLTRNEIERLAEAVHALRPDWPLTSLVSFIHKRHTSPLLDLSIQLIWVAQDPATKTPARIDADGPWKRATIDGRTAVTFRAITDADCAICFRPLARHMTDHEYEPQHARVTGERMPESVRESIEETRRKIELQVTAAKEAEDERKQRTVEEVTNHTEEQA